MGIGPSTKETSLHHFRDPLLDVVSDDLDVDLLGVMVVGSPQENEYKNLVGKRAAVWLEAMRADGVIVSCDGWGNSHVDFANTFEEIGKREIPSVGVTFNGVQAKFVVSNKYMDTIVDMNKSAEGIETEVVGENNTDEIDAKKALAFLKLKMRKADNEQK
ncbi:MAG: glycine/sarcosine/betaine reductase component B subunit [Clostridioides sp.]|jgi:D-proline reductase (dithiol) PrdE|nr:glycine/sarcosine/betaine reductase component B subunit [Clostridioides sp.]